MLAPHYKEHMEKMYSDLARATRFVTPHPLDVEILGHDLVVEMNKSAYRTLANPWDEEDVIAVALQDYQAEELWPNRERVQEMARGFLHRFFGNTLWGKTFLMRGIGVKVHDTFQSWML